MHIVPFFVHFFLPFFVHFFNFFSIFLCRFFFSTGEGYASSFAYSAFLALFVVVFAPIIGKIPMATLAGLMLNVAFNTFEWKESFALLRKSRRSLQAFLDLIGELIRVFSLTRFRTTASLSCAQNHHSCTLLNPCGAKTVRKG